jgi:hypothetical protein
MKVYSKVPRWWFGVLLAVSYGIAQATDYTGHSHFTWWQLTIVRPSSRYTFGD